MQLIELVLAGIAICLLLAVWIVVALARAVKEGEEESR